MAQSASSVPGVAGQIKANLKGPLPKVYLDMALHTYRPMADFLKSDVPKVFADVKDEAAQAEFKKQNAVAIAAFLDLDKYFTGLRKSQVEDFAMGADLFGKMIYAKTEEADRTVVEAVAAVAAARGLPRAQVALAWVLQQPVVTSPIVGATKLQHLEDALAAEQLVLTHDELTALEAPYTPHRTAGFV